MENTTIIKPKTIAELMPGLSGILSMDAKRTLTAKKQPRPTIAQTRTTEKVLKPMTIAEMKTELLALKAQSPRRPVQGAGSVKKKAWNSSVKVQSKKKSHTDNGQLNHNPVRKVLNFQPKSRVTTNLTTTTNIETPKFPKPEYRPKKSIYLQATNNVRISGICKIAETPVFNKPTRSRITLANKENLPTLRANIPSLPARPSVYKKPASPKIVHKQLFTPKVLDTPLLNESSCDASFLQKEKEIQDNEESKKGLSEERTLENIAEVSPPALSMSTPFKDYRNIKEYFNESVADNSALYNDNTIMSFEKPNKENSKREESVIVSLCDLLNKASVSSSEKMSTELHDLLEVEKRTELNIKMIENSIQTLLNIKESQLKSLLYVKKLICEKQNGCTKPEKTQNKTLIMEQTKDVTKEVKMETLSPGDQVISKPCSVIKSCVKSPSYKIPKKNLCLRKKVFYKSMPNVSNDVQTPNKEMNNKALNIYMSMKEHMNFLNTPVVKHRVMEVPDTPAVTSHNLQVQLDKLYGAS